MCGRFTLTADAQQLAETFALDDIPTSLEPRYNIAPTQPIAVITHQTKQIQFFKWGLVPSWAKDPKIGSRMINARSETLAQKPSFKNAYRYRRCLVLADGFYEWQKNPHSNTKIPIYIHLADHQPFAFAGLWESWSSGDGRLTCTIITTTPNNLIADIHKRMPVILSPTAYNQWLDPEEQSPDRLGSLLKPYPTEPMNAYPVSRRVNNPRHDSPDCITPLET